MYLTRCKKKSSLRSLLQKVIKTHGSDIAHVISLSDFDTFSLGQNSHFASLS